MQFETGPIYKTVTIASSGTTSTVLDTEGYTFMSFLMPDTVTGATISFKACDTPDGTFQVVASDDGTTQTAFTITATEDRWVTPVATVATALAPHRYLKLVSALAEAAERSIVVALR